MEGTHVLTMRSCKKAWRASTSDAVSLRAMACFCLCLGCVCQGAFESSWKKGRRSEETRGLLMMVLASDG